MKTIYSFTSIYSFLSNFYHSFVKLDGIIYPSVEHAFQAAKTLDADLRKPFHKHRLLTAGDAKRMGRKLKLRPDWEHIKLQIMEDLLFSKFSDPVLKQMLLDTGDAKLIEGNTWGDTFWGEDLHKGGQNHLGKLLMKIRENYEKESIKEKR